MQIMRLELIFILDRSASMMGLEQKTVDSFNAMITQQKKMPGECVVTTVLFDSECEILHDRAALQNMQPMTTGEFTVRGHTALLDTVGRSVERIQAIHNFMSKDSIPEQTMVVIMTDGMENASCWFDTETVKSLVRRQIEQKNWKFLFLGANMDALSVAPEIGIEREYAVTFISDGKGVALSYEAVSQAIREYRETGKISSCWRVEIQKDFTKR